MSKWGSLISLYSPIQIATEIHSHNGNDMLPLSVEYVHLTIKTVPRSCVRRGQDCGNCQTPNPERQGVDKGEQPQVVLDGKPNEGAVDDQVDRVQVT